MISMILTLLFVIANVLAAGSSANIDIQKFIGTWFQVYSNMLVKTTIQVKYLFHYTIQKNHFEKLGE